ncbi:MAG: putative molybdenum carrier protein [Planctomycetia bacterium]|nr:putative molybdenum carrier protein [Planctomycetia bacterium]
MRLKKIISGGQTGVDRAALDIAMEIDIPHGGWCPRGRRAEDGVIPDKYQLEETETKKYQTRTKRNIVDSDGTLIIFREQMSDGTKFTQTIAERLEKPLFIIDANMPEIPIEEFWSWVLSNNIEILNIAGPRLSNDPELAKSIHELLRTIFSKMPEK